MPLTPEIYDAFQRVEFDRWDPVIADDVLINSPAGRDLRGLVTLKDFVAQSTRLAYRIDLVDDHIVEGVDRRPPKIAAAGAGVAGRESR
jgi:hypothetical protein